MTLGIVLVVGGDVAGGLDDAVEAGYETGRPPEGGLAQLIEAGPGIARPRDVSATQLFMARRSK